MKILREILTMARTTYVSPLGKRTDDARTTVAPEVNDFYAREAASMGVPKSVVLSDVLTRHYMKVMVERKAADVTESNSTAIRSRIAARLRAAEQNRNRADKINLRDFGAQFKRRRCAHCA